MKSWILTCLYLFKDTLHRWKERPASPLSRILVAFFLSLCALSFLANYVLSAKMLHDEIRKNGADLIIVFDTVRDGEPSKKNLLQHELPSLYGCDVLVLNDARAGVARVGKTVFPILEYNMESCSFLSALGLEDVATVLLYNPSRSPLQAGPCTVTIADFDFSLNASPLPEGHLLGRLYPSGVILAPEGTFSSGQEVPVENCRYIIRVHEMTAARIRDIEEVLNNMVRYDGSMTMVQTHVGLLDRLEVLMGNQTECRTGFSLGIAVIVGILLTALASMEFRQNEYVYTLMKSFGVRPVLLIMAFIVENAFLIGVSFAGAVWAFMKTQRIVLGEFFKLGNSVLTYADIRQDLWLLGISLAGCVLLSSIPVAFSACRRNAEGRGCPAVVARHPCGRRFAARANRDGVTLFRLYGGFAAGQIAAASAASARRVGGLPNAGARPAAAHAAHVYDRFRIVKGQRAGGRQKDVPVGVVASRGALPRVAEFRNFLRHSLHPFHPANVLFFHPLPPSLRDVRFRRRLWRIQTMPNGRRSGGRRFNLSKPFLPPLASLLEGSGRRSDRKEFTSS